MEGSIRFPHLGITLSHVIKTISFGHIEIACYGIVLAIAMVAGIGLVTFLAGKTGQKEEDYMDFAIFAVLVSVLCARAYYVIFSWDYYKENLLEIINIRQGGLAIYGGVIGGVCCAVFFCRKRKLSFLRFADTAVCGLVLGQVIGRWGNFFNREAFGGYTDGLFAMQLPTADVRPSEITQEMWEHVTVIDGTQFIQVHPTFLYESLWNLGVFLILLFLTAGKRKGRDGTVFYLYLFLYGCGRFWIEQLRTDQLKLPGEVIPVSAVLSGILVLISAAMLYRQNKK